VETLDGTLLRYDELVEAIDQDPTQDDSSGKPS